jgi:hypothetical protein
MLSLKVTKHYLDNNLIMSRYSRKEKKRKEKKRKEKKRKKT